MCWRVFLICSGTPLVAASELPVSISFFVFLFLFLFDASSKSTIGTAEQCVEFVRKHHFYCLFC